MSRFAIIDAGRVVNHAEADSEFAAVQGWVLAADSRIGDLWDGVQFTSPPAPAPTVADFDAALSEHLDQTAQSRRYDNRITCALRAGYQGPFQAEGEAFALWMDTCNALAYQLLAEVQVGSRPMPATTQALIDELPKMVWPT